MKQMAAMHESAALRSAREHLSRAEAGLRSVDGLHHLEKGLGLLDEVMARDSPGQKQLARNLATTYLARIVTTVGQRLDSDRAVPEPELEHLFKVILALDEADVESPPNARAVKIELARRLIDCYYEGYTPEQKQSAIEQLTAVAEPKRRRKRR
jgi:hypothetical protein